MSVLLTAMYFSVLLNLLSVPSVNGIELPYLLRANASELAKYYPNIAWVIYYLSRSILIGIPILLSLLVMALRKPIRNEITWMNLMLFLSVTVVSILLAEFVMRMTGVVPGQLRYNKWVTVVDELHEIPGFRADRNGLFVVDTSIEATSRSSVLSDQGLLQKKRRLSQNSSVSVVAEVRLVYEDHENVQGPLKALIGNFRAGESEGFNSCVAHYLDHPINEHGFYSIPFDTMVGGRPRVLLLGDSFTWGHSTSNKTLSFANILLSRGMAVYNTGISGADVPQYKKVLEVYGNELKPHVVVVNFFIGNDVDFFERTPIEGIPIHFSTNAGNLMSFQDGDQLQDAEAAYKNILKYLLIPRNDLLGRIAHGSAIATRLWSIFFNLGLLGMELKFPEKPSDEPVSNRQIRQMIDQCRQLNIPLIVSVIPELKEDRLDGVASVKNLFDDIPYHEPQMTIDMYRAEDGHFNDSGHLFYADYLHELITTELERAQIKADTTAMR